MKAKAQEYIDECFRLRKDIDIRAEILKKEHQNHLSCKSGCDLCCMDYNIFPVEFYSILDELQNRKFNPKPLRKKEEESSSCVFLNNHKCTIYQSRPVICRTQGLPLLYTNDDDEWELSTCELNFINFDFGRFSEKNTFAQDKYNSKLFVLNRKFIANFPDNKYDEKELIPLRKLTEYLK
ncbi:MAG TPA: YkgJ family cysteine cluster protein [Draconibacterium sp.]|nr:YkgJ family cysteine cluster protein [Draconibacterium sp.]